MTEAASDIMVSVCCVCYNQEQFIRQTLDGFLMQRVNFAIEIIVHDDASTDETQEIIKMYAAKDKRIIPILRKTNIKSKGIPVFPVTYKMARGKYISICEGDDYWTDELKLQKQFDYLEKHSNCSAVFTDMILINREGEFISESRRMPSNINQLQTYHLMQGNAIHTANVFFKRIVVNQKAIDFIGRMPYGDMALYLICSTYGPIGYIPELTSAYRVNVGLMQNYDKAQRARNSMFIREAFIKEFGNRAKLRDQYRVGKKKYYQSLSAGDFRNGRVVAGLKEYCLFWIYTVYRVFPKYPILEHISIRDHLEPIRELFTFLVKRRRVVK